MIQIKRSSQATKLAIESTDLDIYRVIGTTDIDGKGTEHLVEDVDPFIFLDEADIHQAGDTFSAHPHQGLAAVSHIISGEIKMWDNHNGESAQNNRAGGLFYINSGRGVAHSEVAVKPSYWLQLWLNPGIYEHPLDKAYAQLVAPDQTPIYHGDAFQIRVLLGEIYGCSSPVQLQWPILYTHISVDEGASIELDLTESNWNGFIYVLSGSGEFGSDQTPGNHQTLLEFDTKHSTKLAINNTSNKKLTFMLGLGKPHGKAFYKLLGNGGAVVADSEENAREAMQTYEWDKENFGK